MHRRNHTSDGTAPQTDFSAVYAESTHKAGAPHVGDPPRARLVDARAALRGQMTAALCLVRHQIKSTPLRTVSNRAICNEIESFHYMMAAIQWLLARLVGAMDTPVGQ